MKFSSWLPDTIARRFAATGAERDGIAAAGQLNGGGGADSGRGTGDERGPAVGERGETGHA